MDNLIKDIKDKYSCLSLINRHLSEVRVQIGCDKLDSEVENEKSEYCLTYNDGDTTRLIVQSLNNTGISDKQSRISLESSNDSFKEKNFKGNQEFVTKDELKEKLQTVSNLAKSALIRGKRLVLRGSSEQEALTFEDESKRLNLIHAKTLCNVQVIDEKTNENHGLIVNINDKGQILEFIDFINNNDEKRESSSNTICTAIFHPYSLKPIVYFLWNSFLQKVRKGSESLADDVQLNKAINLIDSPCELNKDLFVPFDHLGAILNEYSIISNGSMNDEKDIAYLKKDAFLRSFNIEKIPSPYPVSLQIIPGNSGLKSMLSGVSAGVYIIECKNFWQSLEDNSIIYGAIDLGFRLKNGKIAGSIKNSHFKLSINDALGNDLVNISSDYLNVAEFHNKMPFIQIDNIEIV